MFLLAQFTLANGFSGFNYANIHSSRYEVCIKQFLALLQARMPEKYGARVQDSNVSTHPESNPSTQPKHSTKQSAPSGSSQKVPVVKRRIKMRANKKKTILRDEDSEDSKLLVQLQLQFLMEDLNPYHQGSGWKNNC